MRGLILFFPLKKAKASNAVPFVIIACFSHLKSLFIQLDILVYVHTLTCRDGEGGGEGISVIQIWTNKNQQIHWSVRIRIPYKNDTSSVKWPPNGWPGLNLCYSMTHSNCLIYSCTNNYILWGDVRAHLKTRIVILLTFGTNFLTGEVVLCGCSPLLFGIQLD